MSRRWTSAVVIGVAVWLVNTSGQAPSPKLPYRDGELLMEFRDESTPAQRAAFMNGQQASRIRRFEALGIERVKLRSGQAVADALVQFAKHPDVASVQPDYERTVVGSAPPNDPYWLDGTLWGLRKIQADTAWTDYTTGADTVVIANVDTGVNYTHPDLAANMWRNPGEIPGNQKDDDGNGYIDDVYGIDSANNDGDPMDDHGHGTHTAGTAAAAGNNGVGVVGVSWRSKILACKFMTAAGSGYDSDAIECFNYVVAMRARGINVRVTSNSWGAPRQSGGVPNSMKNAINAMGNAGIVSVFAAGNSAVNNDTTPHDPASIPVASIISVAASNSQDQRSGFSNYGATSTDLAAPGEGIVSTRGDSYSGSSGTSMAAPHVAGAAALLASAVPSISMTSLKTALLNSVDQSSAWTGLVVSGGRLNVWRALMAAGANAAPTISITNPADGATLAAPTAATFAANASDPDGTVASVQFFVNGTSIGTDTSAPYSVTWNGAPAGTYALRAKATDNLGATKEATATVTAAAAPVGGGASATFLRTDPTTSGNWLGQYGSEGYLLRAVTPALPAYATVTPIGAYEWTWSASTTESRALRYPSGVGRLAATWYGTAYSFRVQLIDGQSHQIGLYMLDWDRFGRVQRIDILDTATGATLDSRTFSGLTEGQYAIWTLRGDVTIRVTALAGKDAVVSGFFFGSPGGSDPGGDPGSGAAGTAAFVGADTTTAGTWVGKYGAEGHLLRGVTSALPAYAALTPNGAFEWTWSASTTESRALQYPSGVGRLAATWYGTAYSFRVQLIDGQPHRVGLYMVDWDRFGRVQRIDILDTATGATLDSRMFSGFTEGQYAVWTLSGDVTIRVTALAGKDAVVSGFFFGSPGGSNPGGDPGSGAAGTAAFVRTDTATHGNWIGQYGAEGHQLNAAMPALPAYATVTPNAAFEWTWSTSTTESRALQHPSGIGRLAATWYGTAFSFRVKLTDGQKRQVALYMMDWDRFGRVQRIDILDSATGATLDSRTFSGFAEGQYGVWTLGGDVTIQVTILSGKDAVIGGFFFGPSGP